MTALAFQADLRKAATDLLRGYATAAGLKLQIYRSQPGSIEPPTAFVDRKATQRTYTGPTLVQNLVRVEVVVLYGRFDSGDASDQLDAFCDGFMEYVDARYHQAGGETLLGLAALEEEPQYIPEWPRLREADRVPYYATRLVLEGFAEN